MPEGYSIDWENVFDQVLDRRPPAGVTDLVTLFNPIMEDEIAAINAQQRNPFPVNDPMHAAYRPFDPSRWFMPHGPLPTDYLSFLEWSDGATWQRGEREFGCLALNKLREYLLHYCFPQFMRGAMPFGLDGGGIFGVFDLRVEGACGGVYAIDSGDLDWGSAVRIADSFIEFCQGTTRVDEVYFGK